MSKFYDSIIERAKNAYKHIVLPEGEEKRIIKAAVEIERRKIAKITLLGRRDKIIANAEGADLTGLTLINPSEAENFKEFVQFLYELRKDKGMTPDKAEILVHNPLFYACIMIKKGLADGMVAGSINSTGDVLRPALQIIKPKEGISTVSSCFLMAFPEGSPYGENGIMVFGDCAVIPDPTAEQLVDIAIASAASASNIGGIKEPKVAMLSFSTLGSAKHPLIDKVITATETLKSKNLPFDVDGELQLDAAIEPSVAAVKASESKVAGNANVLIFPDLQAGNIGYKIAQRFGNAEAIGPICQGLKAPVNDLSRGCSVNDIIGVVAITSLQ